MLTVFGLWGVLAGGVVAVMGPMAMSLFDSAEAGKELEDQLDNLTAATKRYIDANEQTSQSFMLGDEYGEMAAQARELFQIEREIAELRANEAMRAVTRTVASELGAGGALGLDPAQIRDTRAAAAELQAEIDRLSAQTMVSDEAFRRNNDAIGEMRDQLASMRDVSRGMDDLADSLGVTEEAAREIAARFAEFDQAEGARARAYAMRDLVVFIDEASANLSNAEDEGKALYDQLFQAALQALELSRTEIAPPISYAADEAARLATNMQNSAAAWQAYREAQDLAAIGPGMTRAPRGGGLDLYDVSLQGDGLLPPQAEGWKPPRSTRTGRSGTSAADKAAREAQQAADAYERLKRSLDPLADANAEYADNQQILNDALKAGKITAVDFAVGMAMVDEAHQKAIADLDGSTDRLQTMQDGVAGFTDALFDNSTSISDWAANALIEFAKVQAQFGILKALGLSTEGVDPGSTFVGSILEGLSGKRAMGGPVNANSAYLIGEKGPEIMVPTSSGVVVPNHQLGGGGSDVQVNIKTPPGTTATARRKSGGIDIEVMMERKFEEFIESGGADGAMNRSFGLRGRPRS
ncbi:hypothetical protein [Salipiger sp. PrR003]|uniref:hypothetical protein n=1 Tax=Salipiger sp. PrR003 TaxID=2706776 RepID=UPI0013DD3A0A|nr:hypothetical protein [Salipiger sp. PrR003]NDV52104.1 hypothetical protein [Salipiger sp. PrR003]